MKQLNITVTGSCLVGDTTIAKSLMGSNSVDMANSALLDVYKQKLKLHGSEVFIKISDIKSNDTFPKEQIEVIENSDVLIIAFSRDSQNTFDHAIDIYDMTKGITNALIVFVGTTCKTDGKRIKRTRSRRELEKEFKENFDSLYYEISDLSNGRIILKKLYEEVQIKQGPYHTTVISMNRIRLKEYL